MRCGSTCIVSEGVVITIIKRLWHHDGGGACSRGGNKLYRGETDVNSSGHEAAVITRHVDVGNGPKRGVGHWRLEVDARGHRRCVLVVGHACGGGEVVLRQMLMQRQMLMLRQMLVLVLRREPDVGGEGGRSLRQRRKGAGRVSLRWRAGEARCEAGSKASCKRLAGQLDALGRVNGRVPLVRSERAVWRSAELREARGLVVGGGSCGVDADALAVGGGGGGGGGGGSGRKRSRGGKSRGLGIGVAAWALEVHLTKGLASSLEPSRSLGRLCDGFGHFLRARDEMRQFQHWGLQRVHEKRDGGGEKARGKKGVCLATGRRE